MIKYFILLKIFFALYNIGNCPQNYILFWYDYLNVIFQYGFKSKSSFDSIKIDAVSFCWQEGQQIAIGNLVRMLRKHTINMIFQKYLGGFPGGPGKLGLRASTSGAEGSIPGQRT